MSVSATIYRVSANYFAALRKANGEMRFDIKKALDYAVFEKTFCGLEFVLSKISPSSSRRIATIFEPNEKIEPEASMGNEEAWCDDEGVIAYHSPEEVREIYSLLDPISEQAFAESFDPVEMNKKRIYPDLWSAGRDRSIAFNELHLSEEFRKLKAIFGGAKIRGDRISNARPEPARNNSEYLVVFAG